MQIEMLNKYIRYFDLCIDAHTKTHTSIQAHIHTDAHTQTHITFTHIHTLQNAHTNKHTSMYSTFKHMQAHVRTQACNYKYTVTTFTYVHTQALYHFIFLLLSTLLKLHTYNSCCSMDDAREGNAFCLFHCPLPVLLHCHAKNMSHSIILSFIVINY